MKKQVINNIRLVIYNNDGKEMQPKEPHTGMGALLQDGDAFVFNKEGRIARQYSPNPVFYRGNVLTSRVLKDGKYSIRAEFGPVKDLDTLQRLMVLDVVTLMSKIKVLNEY